MPVCEKAGKQLLNHGMLPYHYLLNMFLHLLYQFG